MIVVILVSYHKFKHIPLITRAHHIYVAVKNRQWAVVVERSLDLGC